MWEGKIEDIMMQWRKNLYVLWVGTFVAGMSFSLVSPFLPMLLTQVGVVSGLKLWSGVAFSSSFVASAIMSPVWGALSDKYGRKIMIIRSGIGIGMSYILMAFAVSGWQIIALRAFNGLLSGFIPSSIALVATNTPDDRLGRALGILQTGGAFGSVMGPLVGGIMSYYMGIQTTLLVAGFVLFSASLIVMVGVKEVQKPNRDMETHVINDLRTAISNKVLLGVLLTVMLFQVAIMIIQPILPIFITALIPTTADPSLPTGIVFSLAGIATVIGAPFWGRKGEKIGYQRVLMLGLLGAGLLSLPHALVTKLYQLALLRFAFGIFMAALMPASNALIARAVPSDFRGRAFGISTSFNQAGAALGPLMGGVIGEVWSSQMVFVVTGLLLLFTFNSIRGKEWEQQLLTDASTV